MNKEMEHTLLPFEVVYSKDKDLYSIGNSEGIIAHLTYFDGRRFRGLPFDRVNAAFIVKACNNHERALEIINRFIRWENSSENFKDIQQEAQEFLKEME